jgi:hypothetical protein
MYIAGLHPKADDSAEHRPVPTRAVNQEAAATEQALEQGQLLTNNDLPGICRRNA